MPRCACKHRMRSTHSSANAAAPRRRSSRALESPASAASTARPAPPCRRHAASMPPAETSSSKPTPKLRETSSQARFHRGPSPSIDCTRPSTSAASASPVPPPKYQPWSMPRKAPVVAWRSPSPQATPSDISGGNCAASSTPTARKASAMSASRRGARGPFLATNTPAPASSFKPGQHKPTRARQGPLCPLDARKASATTRATPRARRADSACSSGVGWIIPRACSACCTAKAKGSKGANPAGRRSACSRLAEQPVSTSSPISSTTTWARTEVAPPSTPTSIASSRTRTIQPSRRADEKHAQFRLRGARRSRATARRRLRGRRRPARGRCPAANSPGTRRRPDHATCDARCSPSTGRRPRAGCGANRGWSPRRP